MNKRVCITGVSTGLGYSMMSMFLAQNWEVFGTVRNELDRKRLLDEQPAGLCISLMDISEEEDRMRASDELEAWLNGRGLNVVINNAGIVAPGPLAFVNMDEVRHQFEVNVFGLLRFTQLLIPLLQKEGTGRIINIGSVSGLMTSPFSGAYSASKFALEAVSDGLRRELSSFGIEVVLLEPGPVKTPIWQKNVNVAEKFSETPYGDLLENAKEVVKNTERDAIEPIEVAKVAYKAATIARPKTRYIIARKAWIYWIISRCIPDRWLDRILVRDRISKDEKTRPW